MICNICEKNYQFRKECEFKDLCEKCKDFVKSRDYTTIKAEIAKELKLLHSCTMKEYDENKK